MSDLTTPNPLNLLALNPTPPAPAPGAAQSQPVPLDPKLMLMAAGASSTSKDGTATTSLTNAGGANPSPADNLRSQAAQLLANAAQTDSTTENSPAPALHNRPLTPLETALGMAIGGALNASSPFTSEGTHGLEAFMYAKKQAAQDQFQSEVQQHSAAIDAARQGYRMASDQARGLTDQAGADDQQARAQSEQTFQETLRRESEQARIQEENLASMHRNLASGEAVDATEKLQQQRILQQKLVDVLSQTGPGRAMLAAQAGVALRISPDQIVQLARIATESSPAAIAKSLKKHLIPDPQIGLNPLPPARQ